MAGAAWPGARTERRCAALQLLLRRMPAPCDATVFALPSEPGRGFCQYLAPLAQLTILTPQPPQLLVLATGQAAISAAGVSIGLVDPIAEAQFVSRRHGSRMLPDSLGRSGRWITSGFGTGFRMWTI